MNTEKDLANEFVNYLTSLQERAESGYNQYTHDTCILPHDAVYLYRVDKVIEFGNLITELMEKSNLDLKTVMNKLKPARETFIDKFGSIIKQIDLLLNYYSK